MQTAKGAGLYCATDEIRSQLGRDFCVLFNLHPTPATGLLLVCQISTCELLFFLFDEKRAGAPGTSPSCCRTLSQPHPWAEEAELLEPIQTRASGTYWLMSLRALLPLAPTSQPWPSLTLPLRWPTLIVPRLCPPAPSRQSHLLERVDALIAAVSRHPPCPCYTFYHPQTTDTKAHASRPRAPSLQVSLQPPLRRVMVTSEVPELAPCFPAPPSER